MRATGSTLSALAHRLPSRFRIGDWTVDSSSCYLSRGEESVKLEPKVMEVLVFLAARPGEVVSREALEGSVWAGTVVGYDTVTGAIQKLRRAFGDNSRQPRIIETLSKKGYRLVTSVAPLVEPPGPVPPVTERSAAVSGERVLSKPLLVSIAVVLILLVAILTFRPWTAEIKNTSTLPSRPKSIAVLPFDNLSGDPTQDYFSDGITDDLITQLAKLSDLTVIARDSTFVYKGQPVDVR